MHNFSSDETKSFRKMSEKHRKKRSKDKEKPQNSLNSLLIVENTSGSLFFVENERKNKSLKKLLKKKRRDEKLQKIIPQPIIEPDAQ